MGSAIGPIFSLVYTYEAYNGYTLAFTQENDPNFNTVFYGALGASVIELVVYGITLKPIYEDYQ